MDPILWPHEIVQCIYRETWCSFSLLALIMLFLTTLPFAAEGGRRKRPNCGWPMGQGYSMAMTWSSEEIPSYLQFPIYCRLTLASSQSREVWGADQPNANGASFSENIPPTPSHSFSSIPCTHAVKMSASSCTECESRVDWVCHSWPKPRKGLLTQYEQ